MKTSEKLAKLADFLDKKISSSQWCYSAYGSHKSFYSAHEDCYTQEMRPSIDDKNSVGCAAGWAQECFPNQKFWQNDRCFDIDDFEKFMKLDTHGKKRFGDWSKYSDYERLFLNADGKIINSLSPSQEKKQVVSRMRKCAKHYESLGR